jgi:ribonuclease HI
MPASFTCRDCGAPFTVPQASLAKYPGWTPKQCGACRSGKTPAAATPADVLLNFDGGPQTGVFTDGGCDPNPGAGGWAAVKVRDGVLLEGRAGHEDATTNNRMELRALLEAFAMLGEDDEATIYSDSSYSVKAVTEWAPGWERNGWRRGKTKKEPVLNVDLMQELLAAARAHPRVQLAWLKGHAGSRWNEYADALVRQHQHPERRAKS